MLSKAFKQGHDSKKGSCEAISNKGITRSKTNTQMLPHPIPSFGNALILVPLPTYKTMVPTQISILGYVYN